MKNIKIKHSLLALLLSSIVIFSCNDDSGFLDDNLTLTGRHFPVIASFFADVKNSPYVINEVSVIENVFMSFWSEDPIKQINVYQTISHLGSNNTELVSSTNYSPDFVDSLRADVFLFDYFPPQVEAQTDIEVEVEVENENGLTKSIFFDMFYDVILDGNEGVYQELSTATFDYTYWSGTAIDAIDLVQYTSIDTTVVFTVPNQASFSGGFVLDTYQFNQLVPSQILPDSTVTFEVQLINNAQADTIKSAFTFKVSK
jgi:hypothetical protein